MQVDRIIYYRLLLILLLCKEITCFHQWYRITIMETVLSLLNNKHKITSNRTKILLWMLSVMSCVLNLLFLLRLVTSMDHYNHNNLLLKVTIRIRCQYQNCLALVHINQRTTSSSISNNNLNRIDQHLVT
jgi:hypothetical protein